LSHFEQRVGAGYLPLPEAYRSPADPKEHKKTAHYQTWRDTVAEMMAEPRSSVKYNNIFPDDEGWG
jgi:autoinducer 2-degrading protein